MIRPWAGMSRLMKDWIMSMGPKMFVSYVFLASERSKSNAGITQGRPLSRMTHQLSLTRYWHGEDSRIIDQDIKVSLRELLDSSLAFIDTLLARNIQGQNIQAHRAEIFD